MDATESARPSAFSTLASTLVAPEEAFSAIRERPLWGLAVAVTIVLAALGGWLGTAAVRHMIEVSYQAQLANDPRIAALPPARAAAETQRVITAAVGFANYTWAFSIVIVPIVVLIEATILFAVKSVVQNDVTYRQLFALSAHVQFIAIGIGSIILGLVVALHSPTAYRTQADFISSVPTAAWLVPGASLKLTAFLSSISPFSVWATAILGLGLIAVARFRAPAAWATAIGLLIAGAGWAAAFAR